MLINAGDLPVRGLRTAIGKYDAIKVEVAARWNIAWPVIAPIGPIRYAVFIVFEQSLVDPVPDESTGKVIVAIDYLPVFGKIPRAVAH